MPLLRTVILFLGFNYTFMSNLLFPAFPGIQKLYHLSAIQLSLIASMPALINILLQPLAGWFSDRIDRKIVILLGLGAYAIGGSAIAAVVLTVSTFGFVLLGRSLMGFGELGAFPQYLALIREKMPVGERQTMMGKMELFTSLGGTIAPSIGGFLASASLGLPFVGCALAALGAGILYYISTRVVKATPLISEKLDPGGNNEKQKWVFHHSFLGGFVVLGTLVACQTFIGSYVDQVYEFSTKQIGFTLAVIPLTMALGSLLMIRFGGERITTISLAWVGLIGIAGMVVLAWAGQPWMTIFGLALIGLSIGFWLPAIDHDISEAGLTKTAGSRLSFFQQAKSLGVLTLPPIIGLVIDKFESYNIAFIILSLLCLLLGLITLQIRRKNIIH